MKSLRNQLTLRLLILTSLLFGVAGYAIYFKVKREFTEEFNRTLNSTARSLASVVQESHAEVDLGIDPKIMPEFNHKTGTMFFLYRSNEGQEIGRSKSLGNETISLGDGKVGKREIFDMRFHDGRNFRCVGLHFNEHGEDEKQVNEKQRPVILYVGRDRSRLDHTLNTLWASLIGVGSITLAALAALVCWGVGRGLASLDRLGTAVSGIDAGSLYTRLETTKLPLELRFIAERINGLLGRVEAAFLRERRFTANVAHELRTPLAELRAAAEVNLSTPATASEQIESWRDALATTTRMESLSLRLLELARVESPQQQICRQTVALAEAVSKAWKISSNKARLRNISIDASIPEAATFQTESILLGVILENLCGNAVAHAPEGSTLQIRTSSNHGKFVLSFSNPCGDLTDSDIANLFERFWRKDRSRTDGSRHGLGLAIATEFTTLLGGSLTAKLVKNGELEFLLEMQ